MTEEVTIEPTPSEPVVTPEDIAQGVMEKVQGYLNSGGFLRKEFVSPRPVRVLGEARSILVSPLMDRRHQVVGTVRVFVFAPVNENLKPLLRVEWTKDEFGFWFRKDLRLRSSRDGYGLEADRAIKSVAPAIRNTTDRSVNLKSQLMMHKRIRKNPVRDRAVRSGLVLG